MTADARFERDLTALLEDLYVGPSPDYSSEALATATHRRQRPSWTFPGRWLPMADITAAAPVGAGIRWRTIGVAVLIIALLVAALAIVAGSRQTKVPPPFGAAANGRIAYMSNGDLFSIDPITGTTTPLLTGPTTDDQPVFSPDGTRLAFRRSALTIGSPGEDVVVANADGSNPIVITPTPIPNGPAAMQWAPDSRSLLVGWSGTGEILQYDVARAVPPKVVAHGAYFGTAPFQAPEGAVIMIARGSDWSALNLASGVETPIATVDSDGGFPRWSPDGSKVVYTAADPNHPDTPLLYVVGADGTGAHPVTTEHGIAEFDPAWSPDGTRIAFNRARRVGDQSFSALPTGVLTLATGVVEEVGPLARDVRAANPSAGDNQAGPNEGYGFDWSPDGRWLLAVGQDANGHLILIDATTGTHRVLDVVSKDKSISWQRDAP